MKNQQYEFWSIPFNSENKWMLTVHSDPKRSQADKWRLVLKGAPERVLRFCSLNSDNAAKAKVEKEIAAHAAIGPSGDTRY